MPLNVLNSAPLDIQISPDLKYAGTERVLLYLNEGLSRAGHTSVVAGPGNSNLGGYGTLLPTRDSHLWIGEGNQRTMVRDPDAYEAHYRTCLEAMADEDFDILHDHPGQYITGSSEYMTRRGSIDFPIVTTIHSIPSPDHPERYAQFKQLQREGRPVHFVGISNSHATRFQEETGVSFDGFVHNGIPLDLFPFVESKQNYMLWLGRLSGIKGADIAVDVARQTGRPLILAGEVHDPDRDLYQRSIEPYLTTILGDETQRNRVVAEIRAGERVVDEGEILYVGPVNDQQKAALYAHALALLQPNRWEEPFGLVPVEAMATGTPVIATDLGALPELIADKVTGHIIPSGGRNSVDDQLIQEGVIRSLDSIAAIQPHDCRARVQTHFSLERMARDYANLYERVLQGTHA